MKQQTVYTLTPVDEIPIKKYDEKHRHKYEANKFTVDKLDGIRRFFHDCFDDTAMLTSRDVLTKYSHKTSTAGLLLDMGFKRVVGWGREAYLSEPHDRLESYYCRDVLELPFTDAMSENSLGEFADATIYDTMGVPKFDFVSNLVKHSKAVSLTMTKQIGRVVGRQSRAGRKYHGEDMPATFRGFVELFAELMSDIGYPVEDVDSTPKLMVIGIINPDFF